MAALLATVGLAASALSAAAAVPVSAAAVPKLAWKACSDPDQSGFDCATARRVPLDYTDPRARTIKLAVIRRLATDPARRLGSLFFNPGGPGGAGTEDLPTWYELFPAQLRARFDIVSWDPRGIGDSTSVQCFANANAEQKFFAGLPDGFPVGRAETRAWIRLYARFGRRCGKRNGDLLVHVSTEASAKDLNLLRRAVGAERLNYLGISYGTLLGATYANLFPNTIRAMVLDGNVDPVAWSHLGKKSNRGVPLSTSLRQGSDKASAKTLRAFLTLCGQASTADCDFSAGSATATRAKFATLLRRLKKKPVRFGDPPQPVSYATLVSQIVNALFAPQPGPGIQGWPAAAKLIQGLWTSSKPDTSRAAAFRPFGVSSARRNRRYAGPEQAIAVQCSDSPNPSRAAAFKRLGALAFARAGDVGPSWSWGDEPCASWPARAAQRYAGPWNRRTASPVLVIGNTGDPSTPYPGAVAMSRYLARGRLLTVDGYGHHPAQSQHLRQRLRKRLLRRRHASAHRDRVPTGPAALRGQPVNSSETLLRRPALRR